MDPKHETLEMSLVAAVENLSLPGEQALARKPGVERRAESFAVEFDDVYTAYVDNLEQLPPESRLLSLQALDSALSAMSGPGNVELWTDDAVKHHPCWEEIRDLAGKVLAQFGLPPSGTS